MATVVKCPHCRKKLRVPEEVLERHVRCPRCGATLPSRLDAASASGDPTRGEPIASAARTGPGAGAAELRDAARSEPVSSDTVPVAAESKPRAGIVKCAYCDERIAAGTPRCPNCGRYQPDQGLLPSDRVERAADDRAGRHKLHGREHPGGYQPHRGNLVITLGLVSIGAGLVAVLASCILAVAGVPAMIGLGIGGIALGAGIPATLLGLKDSRRIKDGAMDPAGQGMTTGGWICGLIGAILGALEFLCCVASLASG